MAKLRWPMGRRGREHAPEIKDSRTGAHLDTEYIKHRLFTTIDVVLYYHQRKLREIYYDPKSKRQRMG